MTQLKLKMNEEPIMTPEVFNTLLENVITNMRDVLASKAIEYAPNSDIVKSDRMHNFKRAAVQLDCTPEKALLGFMMKHWISMQDILNNIELGKPTPSNEYIREKLGDIRNYLVLLEALLVERRLTEQT